MSQYSFTSIPHLHAVSHSNDLITEARQARLVAQVRAAEADRVGSTHGVRRQVGLVLIRAGEFVRGAESLREAA